MNETKTHPPEAARALTSYIEEMLHTESPPIVDPESVGGDPVAGDEWRIFDFGGLKACIPADQLVNAGERARGLEIEASSSECAWLHCVQAYEPSLSIIDLRRLVMPGSDSVFDRARHPGELQVWMARRRDMAFVVGSEVPVQISAYEDIHRCGPGRRRKWLAGSDIETRSVFLDIDGLATVIESVQLTRSGGDPS